MIFSYKRSMFLLGLITVFFGSCRPESLSIDLEQEPVKMVVSSQIVPNSVMVVAISKSISALEYSENYADANSGNNLLDKILVKNAKVSVSYNGVTDYLSPIIGVPGIYTSTSTPQYTNVEYTLNVYNPETGNSVTSKATMLDIVPFNSVSAKRLTGMNSGDITLNISFTDPPNELNWYMINIYTDQSGSQVENFFINDSESQETFLLSDIDFVSSQVNSSHVFSYWGYDTLVTSISNISQEYYDYLLARKRGGSIFSTIVKEPINYPSNIEGGYGFFTTHFPDIKIVVVE